MAVPSMYVGSDVWLVPDQGGHRPTHSSLALPALEKYLGTGLPVTLVVRTLPTADTVGECLDDERVRVWDLGLDDRRRRLGRRAALLLGSLWSLPLTRGDVVVVRLPELVGVLLAVVARLRGAVLVCNVVAETRAASERFGWCEPVVRRLLQVLARSLVSSSAATIYVTERWLQEGLPPPVGRPTLSASNVRLTGEDIATAPRDFRQRPLGAPLVLTAVGDHNSSAKGHDLLIQACGTLVRDGWSVQLHLIGGGPQQPSLQALAEAEGIGEATIFHGYLADRGCLRGLLEATDVFVMPSRTEGLPRALVEAMARGICCLGSRAGGIPELLGDEALFAVDSADAIVQRLQGLVAMPADALTSLVTDQWHQACETARRSDPEMVAAFLRGTVAAGVAAPWPTDAPSRTVR